MAWRTALSDDDSAYVELQAGLFRNQETYAFLEPHETVRFSEYWLPVPDLGGITRATEGAVLAMTRPAPTRSIWRSTSRAISPTRGSSFGRRATAVWIGG